MKDTPWKPTLSFLKKGKANTTIPFLNERIEVLWTFQIPRKRVGFQTNVQCTLTAKNKKVIGSGHAISLKKACCIALAEAWERRLFHFYQKIERVDISTGFAAGRTIKTATLAAIEEYKERHLLYLASIYPEYLNSFSAKNFYQTFLVAVLKRYLPDFNLYIFNHNLGKILLGWSLQRSIFDSIYLGSKTESFYLRKLVYSLLSSTQDLRKTRNFLDKIPMIPKEGVIPDYKSNFVNIKTKVLYARGILPPVVFAYIPTNQPIKLHSQDALFKKIIYKNT